MLDGTGEDPEMIGTTIRAGSRMYDTAGYGFRI
jgi:hypothetical protein